MTTIDRRGLIAAAAALPFAHVLGMSAAAPPFVAADGVPRALHATMMSAIDAWRSADARMEQTWDTIIPEAQARGVSFNAYSDWARYAGGHPAFISRQTSLKAARLAVEAVFMARSRTREDDDLIMEALDLHENHLSWSGAARTVPRWFFTPARYRDHADAVYEREQYWALHPQEVYKLGMPYFLRRMRGEDLGGSKLA